MTGLTIFCFLLVDFLFLSELFLSSVAPAMPLHPDSSCAPPTAAAESFLQSFQLRKDQLCGMPQIHQRQKLTLFRCLGASPTGCLLQSDATTNQSWPLPQRSPCCGAFPPRFTVPKLFPLFLQPCGWHCFLFPSPRYFRVLLVLFAYLINIASVHN